MERAKLTMAIAVFVFAVAAAPRAAALVPYSPRSIWDVMLPLDDPFRILEQSPLAGARALDDSAVALARADWRETSAEHQISLDIPGMKKEDIKIEVDDNRVVRISGERKTEEEVEDERWHRVERTVGKFWRQFRMPENADVDKVSARMEDGVLRISVPKLKEEEVKKGPKVISIDNVSDEKPNISAATKKEL
ncbi:HSP20-like chaperones superfamily protein [Perilla frutescens var. hirtella]|nr:HSP20-like chaperones superfamily protein [Perilla frutescens var. hirtella]